MIKKLLIGFLIAAVLFAGAGFIIFKKLNGLKGISQLVVKGAAERLAILDPEKNALEQAMGFGSPKTYLFLFLNNTELRPGGGFIGAYGVARFDKGIPGVIKVEGTEILDNMAPQDFPSLPPEPLKKYLGVSRFNFRDSNWWPDFASSSRASLDLYNKEKGVMAGGLDGVIGITPTVIEKLLKISGPITVSGQTFNSDNFTEKLEYEVEYGYAKSGLDFNSRKKIMGDLVHALAARLGTDMLVHWRNYFSLAEQMLTEKQIVFYATDEAAQKILEQKNWAGALSNAPGDYILWVDANLGALKTDSVMDRQLSYEFAPAGDGSYVATATMKYANNGSFTWRTTRYRTYSRLYVPSGSVLVGSVGAMDKDRSAAAGRVDEGVEGGRKWFGAFVSIEPQKSAALSFRFKLSPEVVAQIKSGQYNLLVQKQIGALGNKLTLGLDFGKNVVSANPPENSTGFGDGKYSLTTDLAVDRQFSVEIGN